MTMNMPYFMEKDEWFYYDEEEYLAFRLTDKAPKEAYESYKDYLQDALYFNKISEFDYKGLLKEIQSFEKEKIKNLFGV